MSHSAFISNNKCYVFGNNDSGQLGLGNYKNVNAPTEIIIPNDQITFISCGCNYSIVLTLSKKCYVFGNNVLGQLGLGKTDNNVNVPTELIITNEQITSVTCGTFHTIVLTLSKKCYVFGNNIYGQLGLGHDYGRNIPTELILKNLKNLKNDHITYVACGFYHTIVLTVRKKCYVFGRNDSGQLGLGHNRNVNVPTELIIPNEQITSVACGYAHTIILTFNKKCYVFGYNIYGQLGLGHDNNVNIPIELALSNLPILHNDYITSVSCGHCHTIILTSSLKCYVFGDNGFGQLGLGHNDNVNIPIELVILNEKITSVACGTYYTIILTFSKKCYVFGSNHKGQLGLGHDNDVNVPILLPFKVDKLMNQKIIKLNWEIEKLLWLGKMKNPDSNLSLLPHEIICYLRTFLI